MEEELVTGEAVALDVRPTSFAQRVAGGAIDLLVYGLPTVFVLIALLTGLAVAEADAATMRTTSSVTLVVGLVVAPMLVEALSGGRSLGRLAVGARIVRDDGGAITMRHAFVRALLGLIEVFATFGSVALIVALFSARSKRLGDMLAGTYSRHERFPAPVPLDLPIPPPLVDWARTADVARLPDPLARRIASFLRQAARMQPESRDRLAEVLLAEASAYVHPLPPAPAGPLLVAIAALRRERETVALRREAELVERLGPVLGGASRLPERG